MEQTKQKRRSGSQRRWSRWGRWLAQGALLWVMVPAGVLLALRLAWGWEAAHRLERVRAVLRAQGVRFEHPAVVVADDDNPAAAVAEAAELMHVSDDEYMLIWGNGTVAEDEIIWTSEQKKTVLAVLARHQPAFQWIDAAAARKGPIPPADSYYANSYLGAIRQLARLLVVQARLEAEAGDETAALRDLQRIYTLANVVDHGGLLINNLVAIALRATLGQAVEEVEPQMRLDAPAARAEARALIALLEDPAPADAVAWNFESEIGYTQQIILDAGMLKEWWIRPLRDDEIGRMETWMAANVPGLCARNWPASRGLLVAPAKPETNLNGMVHWEADAGYMDRIMTLYFQSRSDTAAAELLLASRLYRAEHGALPKVAADLAPAYLPAVPADPFSATDAPMFFRIDPQGVTVWSVGENGKDDGGSVLFDSSGAKLRRYGPLSYAQPDIVYGAAWRTAKPPGTTAPASGTAPMPAGR